MLFFSINFVIFFLIFIFLYRIFPKYQLKIIFISSIFFYAYHNISHIWLLLYFILLINLFLRAKSNIYVYIFLALTPLLLIKYLNFFLSLIGLNSFHNLTNPLAISFLTFTVISIIVDQHKCCSRKFSTNKVNILLVFFPHLIAGPIIRYKELSSQIRNYIYPSKIYLWMGFYLFTFGIIKKVYFADNIGVVVDFIYLQENYNFIELLLVIFGFSMQIYCDFSGYTDMAIGSAYIMGYKLPINFNQPYLSSSPREFWRRWHITLSNWLRDYVYIKLGGSKSSRLNTLRNLFITMVLAGLWHRANLTFLVWGIFWAAAIFASSLFEKLRFLYVKIILTFILTSLLWVFFRSPNLDVALNIYVSIFKLNFSDSLITIQKYWHIFLLIIFSIVWHFFDTQAFLLRNLRSFLRWKTFFILILFLTLATQTGENNQFIYFEF